MKSKKQIIKWIILVPLVIVLGFGLYTLYSKRLGNDLPMTFGYSTAVVTSGSMEPTLSVDDLVIAKEPESLKVGDTIVFDSYGRLVIHRVKKITVDNKSVKSLTPSEFKKYYEDAKYEELEPKNSDKKTDVRVITKGDANNVSDEPIKLNAIKGKYVQKFGLIGKIITFLQSAYGCLAVLVVMFIIFFISNRFERKKEREQEKELIEQILRLKNEIALGNMNV